MLSCLAVLAAFAAPAGSHVASGEDDKLWTQDQPGIKGEVMPGDRFGASLAFGDFDADGHADLAIGAYGEVRNGHTFAGLVNVLYGDENGISTQDQEWSQDSTGVEDAAEADDQLGRSLAVADFNGDRYDDLAIGAPEERLGGSDGGAIHVLYGGPLGLQASQPPDQLFSQGTGGFPGANEPGDQLGHVLSAGDFNDDGVGDLAIGNAFEDSGSDEDAGAVVVLYGTSAGLTTANASLLTDSAGADPYDLFGASLASGDFTGDGIDDLAVGVPGEGSPEGAGAVTLWRGAGTGLVMTAPLVINRANFGSTPTEADHFGDQLAAGDFDGDAVDDLAIGSRGSDRVLVAYGSSGGISFDGDNEFSLSSPGLIPTPTGDWAEAMTSGEFDGDGIDDLVVAGLRADTSSVFAVVLHGTSEGLTTSRSSLVPGPAERNSGARSAVASADVQGDGIGDLAFGDPRADGDRGVVRVRYGVPTQLCEGHPATVDLALGQSPTSDDDVIVGTSGNDTIRAGAGNDIICAGGGDDNVRGGPGADRIRGQKGSDRLRGGKGPDVIIGASGADVISGNTGRDVLRGGKGGDTIAGGTSADRISGGSGRDRVEGNSGDDRIWGNSARDTLSGGKGNDTVKGGSGNDQITGNSGDDQLSGGKGDDTISGGRGSDRINGNAGADTCAGGPGADTVSRC